MEHLQCLYNLALLGMNKGERCISIVYTPTEGKMDTDYAGAKRVNATFDPNQSGLLSKENK